MNREPQRVDAPICYGVAEYHGKHPECKSCPHFDHCLELCGKAASYVPPGKLKLVSPKISEINYATVKVNSVYDTCFRAIFEKSPVDTFNDATTRRLIELSRESNMSVKLYILTNFLGFQATNPGRLFRLNMLLHPYASRRAETYRDVVVKRYGIFDVESLGKFMDASVTIPERIEAAEELAARWICGYTFKHGGNPYRAFFKAMELRLDPFWLATSDEYLDYVNATCETTDAIASHRESVSSACRSLTRHPKRRDFVLQARRNLVEKVYRKLEDSYGIYLKITVDPNIKSTLELWANVGTAFQHFVCWNAYYGDIAALRRFSHGNYC